MRLSIEKIGISQKTQPYYLAVTLKKTELQPNKEGIRMPAMGCSAGYPPSQVRERGLLLRVNTLPEVLQSLFDI